MLLLEQTPEMKKFDSRIAIKDDGKSWWHMDYVQGWTVTCGATDGKEYSAIWTLARIFIYHEEQPFSAARGVQRGAAKRPFGCRRASSTIWLDANIQVITYLSGKILSNMVIISGFITAVAAAQKGERTPISPLQLSTTAPALFYLLHPCSCLGAQFSGILW